VKEARSFSVLGPLMGGFGSQAFLGCVHDVNMAGPQLKPAVFVFVPDDVVEDPERFKKLWAETEFANGIDHVNVIGVMGLAKLEEGYARVVEYADAESLRSVYRRAQTMKRPLPADIAVAIVADACMGVHYAHELGEAETGQPWVHGGVRPETLQISFAGMAKVTGYGAQVLADSIRKKGATGLITRDTYTAPEQAFGGRASSTVQSDVYALGCILYEALTGKPPFSGDKDLAEAMIKDELSRPSLVGVTPAMAEVVLKATQKRASDRYASALDMRMDLFERCEPANEGDVKRYLDDLFPPNAIPRATRIQMLRKAQQERPEPTGQLLTEMPGDVTSSHTTRAQVPNDVDVEARTGQVVDDLPLAEAEAIDADPAAAAAAAAFVARTMSAAPSTTAPATAAPPSWQANATAPPTTAKPAPPKPAAPSPTTPDELTDPTHRPARARPATSPTVSAPLPPAAPPQPQVVYRTPAGLLVGIGLAGGVAIAFGAVLALRQPTVVMPAPLPAPVAAPQPPPVEVAVPTPAPPPPATTTPEVPAAAATKPVKAAPTGPGTLSISSTPAMAITVDGKPAGNGDATLQVPAGKHTVVGKGGGATVKRVVTVKAGGTENVSLVVEKGGLAIDAPPGCDVYADGKKMGKTPIEPLQLFEGPHSIRVTQNGVEYKQNVTVKAGLELFLTVQFHQN
jgi:serine/threonine protein kinase